MIYFPVKGREGRDGQKTRKGVRAGGGDEGRGVTNIEENGKRRKEKGAGREGRRGRGMASVWTLGKG